MRSIKKWLCLLLTFVLVISILPLQTLHVQAASTGGQLVADIATAEVKLGIGGAPNKYTRYMGFGESSKVAWCACFVSWCAAQAGETAAIGKSSLCQTIRNHLKDTNAAVIEHGKAKAGDIVLYYSEAVMKAAKESNPWIHIGIMVSSTRSVEGNMGGTVKKIDPETYKRTVDGTVYSVANGKVRYYILRPKYSNSNTTTSDLPAHATSENVASGDYYLQNVGSGYYFNYGYGWTGLSYKPMIMSKPDQSPEQTFRLKHVGKGLYSMEVTHPDGGVVNIYRGSGSAVSGDPVTQWKSSGSDYQKFWLTKLSNGNYIIQSATDPSMVITTPTTEWHEKLVMADFKSSDTKQQWKLIPVSTQIEEQEPEGPSPSKTLTISQGKYTLTNVESNRYLMNYACGGWTGLSYKPIILADEDGSPEQEFYLNYETDGMYTLGIVHSDGGNVAVRHAGSQVQANDPLAQSAADTSKSQRFYITRVEDNKYILQSAEDSSLVITAPTGDWHDLLTLSKYQAGNKKQLWVFQPISIPVSSIEMLSNEIFLGVGESELLDYNTAPVNATDARVVWSSSDESVASVNEVGLVTGLRAGKATITCTTKDGTNLSASCKVDVSLPPAPPDDVEQPTDQEIILPCENAESCPGKVFTDMPQKGHWAHDPIDWAVVNNITKGVNATHFGLDDACTRGHVVTFLWRAAGCPEPTASTNPFIDVKEGAFYYKAVLWAVENSITNGMSNNTFAPDTTCTRGQIVTFLWRAAGSSRVVTANNPFKDVSKTGFYYPAMLWAVENGITTGVSATSFAPNTTCTRGQVVTFLYRSYQQNTAFTFMPEDYEIVISGATWDEAFAYAKQKGGKLVCFETKEEYLFVLGLIQEKDKIDNIYYSIGARRDKNDEYYFWTNSEDILSGNPLNSESAWCNYCWESGEPNLVWDGREETVVMMYYDKNEARWAWYDGSPSTRTNTRTYAYIIEYGK